MLSHRRGIWSWPVFKRHRTELFMGSQKREQNPGSTVRILLSPHRAPAALRETCCLKFLGEKINRTRLSYISLKLYYEFFSMRKRRTSVRPVEENSPFSMGKWHGFVHGIDLNNRFIWWKGFCSAGPPVTSFMDRRSRLLLQTPMGAYGLWPFLQPRQGYTKGEEKTHKRNRGLLPIGLLYSWGL